MPCGGSVAARGAAGAGGGAEGGRGGAGVAIGLGGGVDLGGAWGGACTTPRGGAVDPRAGAVEGALAAAGAGPAGGCLPSERMKSSSVGSSKPGKAPAERKAG